MKAILVRVGVDHSYGQWNAPADPRDGRFVYVPIPEKPGTRFHPGCRQDYRLIRPALDDFAQAAGCDLFDDLRCPPGLLEQSMHLDPDFEQLTYGDVGDRRGLHIRQLQEDDLLVFYAGLRPSGPCEHKLIYALIGLFVVKEVVEAAAVPKHRWNENAHTRKRDRGASDIVVRAKPGLSGRFDRCLPIGGYRDRAYRVRPDLLQAWGGLSVNDGYIQRSARPPRFLDPQRFERWLAKDFALLPLNNPHPHSERVVIVHLRRPKINDPGEMRSDPFWEFGSFGCTGCHRNNLMHPDRFDELEGTRLAFAQGGSAGMRLVMLTPPVTPVRHRSGCELRWSAGHMPFRYDQAPLLVDNAGRSDFPRLRQMIRGAARSTWQARFSSAFRTRRQPLPAHVAQQICRTFDQRQRQAPPDALAARYHQALPYAPGTIDTRRKQTYRQLLTKLRGSRPAVGRRGC